MKWVSRAIFFERKPPALNNRAVNITWYPEIEEPIKLREKHYSPVLYIPISFIIWCRKSQNGPM